MDLTTSASNFSHYSGNRLEASLYNTSTQRNPSLQSDQLSSSSEDFFPSGAEGNNMEESDPPGMGSQDIFWQSQVSYPVYQSQNSLTLGGSLATQDDLATSYDSVLDLTGEETPEVKRRRTVPTLITDYMSPQTADHHKMSYDSITQDDCKANKQREMNRKYAKDSRERKNKLLNQLEMEKKQLQSTVEIYTKLVAVYHKKLFKARVEWNRQQIEWYPDTRSIDEGPMMINCLLPVTEILDPSIMEELGNGPMGKILVSSTSKLSTHISSSPPVLDVSLTSTRSDVAYGSTKISSSSGSPTKRLLGSPVKSATLNVASGEVMSGIEDSLPTSASNNFLAQNVSPTRRTKSSTNGGHEIGGKTQTGVHHFLLIGTGSQSGYSKSNTTQSGSSQPSTPQSSYSKPSTTQAGSIKPNSSQLGSSQSQIDADVRPQRNSTIQQTDARILAVPSPRLTDITGSPLALSGQTFYLRKDGVFSKHRLEGGFLLPTTNIDNGLKPAEGQRIHVKYPDIEDLTDLSPSIETV